MNGLLATNRANLSFSDRPRHNRPAKPLPRQQSFLLEPLESRLLLSVDFLAAPAVAPVTNHVDVPFHVTGRSFEEPNLTINNRGDTGNILITSHEGSAASTDMFVNISNGAFPVANRGDTWADIDSTGRAWWTNLDASVANGGTGGVRVVEVNPATGQPIGNGVVVNTPLAGFSDDRQALAVDSFPDSPFHDNIYVIWTRFNNNMPAPPDTTRVNVAVSSDHGVTWTTTDIGAAGFDQQTHIAVGSNGDVYAAYHVQPGFVAGQTFVPDGTTGQVNIFRSTNGGITWTQTANQPFGPGQADITFNRQQAGNTGLIAGTDFLTQGSVTPYVLPDPVRPGQVYVIAADDTDNNHNAGDQSDLYIARSADNGATWQRTLLPTGGTAGNFQLFPSGVIDQFGNIVVTWYESSGVTNAGGVNFTLNYMGMYSVDGGVNWSAPFQINDVAFDPDEVPTTLFPNMGPDNPATIRIGEYFGLDVFGGTAYVAFNGNTPGDNTTSQQVFFDAFAISGSLVVSGDDNGPTNDAFVMQRLAADPNYVEVSVNGRRQYVGLFESLSQVTFNGLAGNDSLKIDSTNGLLSFANGIHYDGGTGFNTLTLTGTLPQTNDTYSVGPNPGQGKSVITTGATTQSVFFQNLAPVFDTVVATDLIVNATPADNAINYTDDGAVGNARVTIDNFEFIEFSNKTTLTINAEVGDDTINLNNTGSPIALTSITVNAGDGEDKITTLAGLPTALTLDGGDGNDLLNASGATGPATLSGGTGNDTLIGGSDSDSISGGSGEDLIDGRGGSNTLDGGADNDTILVSGTAGPDTITTTHGAGTFDITGGLSAGTNTISDIEAVRIEGGYGADHFTLNLSAAGGLNYTVLGGNPIGAPGDVLQVNSGVTMTVTPGPENDSGSVDAATTIPTNVSYDEIELLIVGGGGGGVINGTNGPDTITVIARDSSTHAGADGVQDFTVSVNTGSEVLFIDKPTLTINALSGSDQVTLQTPAPNNAVWDVDVTINGGAPAADTDTLIVQTPGNDPGTLGLDPETVTYTPTAFDSGTLDLSSLSSLVTINTTEVVIYDGQGDNDSLTIVGTIDPDIIVHTPGVNDQAGTFQVNSLLALSYQNLGSDGSLTADGGVGTDTLVYNGTAANDSFTIGNAGEVTLNSRLVLNTTIVEVLTLEGLDGDDTFTLVPAISDSVYSTINLNGGGQASATGDRVFLIGTAGADNILISGQVVSLGGKTINGTGIEDIRLDAQGGDDLINYTGVSGVLENIRVSSSGVVGGGQLSVPSVTLVDFSNVERIDVNGNIDSTTNVPEDTLTFAGTNAVDTFQINLAAAGTDADPILKLQNATGTTTTTLLTLRNYTNFNTLNVQGLDGADTFNVTTAATGPSRDLFVDGGLSPGKKKSTDNLNIFYTLPRPKIIQSAATQEPDAGLVDLDYNTARFVVEYDNIEQVRVLKK
jgi:hypothetical protein